jgi:hypothetical protein
VSISECFVYEPRPSYAAPLSPKTTCGVFLDHLLGLIFAKPSYLRATDIARYACLVNEFKLFEMGGWSGRHGTVAALQVRDLGMALRGWVEVPLAREALSLLPSFRLDAACFIELHAYGDNFYTTKGQWEIKPLLPAATFGRPSLLADRTLKKHITEKLAGLLVSLRIPPGARIKDTSNGTVLTEGGQAYLSIERCHLSSGLYDETVLEVEEDQVPAHDVGREFKFLGKLWPNEAVAALLKEDHNFSFEELRYPKVELPGSWIRAALKRDLTWDDVPRWDP